MRIEHAACSHTGRRASNQDAFLASVGTATFAVSDGMGGLSAGEEASARSVAWLVQNEALLLDHRERVRASPDPDAKLALLSAMEDIFRGACAEIFTMGQERKASMGATLTAGVIVNSDLFVAHIGDSRIYLVRGDTTRCITQDHSIAAERLRRGLMSAEEYSQSELRNILYQAMGIYPEVEPDLLEVALVDGDVLLFCTDGAWGLLSDQEIGRLARMDDLEAMAQAVVSRAYEQGSTDNLTVVVARCRDEVARPLAADWDEVLQSAPLFCYLDAAARDRLAPYLREIHREPGDVIITEGESGEDLFIVLEGRLRVTHQGVHLGMLEKGQHFGEIALALDCSRTATVVAQTQCRLLFLHRDHLEGLILRQPEIGALVLTRLLSHMASQVLELDARILRFERELVRRQG